MRGGTGDPRREQIGTGGASSLGVVEELADLDVPSDDGDSSGEKTGITPCSPGGAARRTLRRGYLSASETRMCAFPHARGRAVRMPRDHGVPSWTSDLKGG
jgi:hypothetical protein